MCAERRAKDAGDATRSEADDRAEVADDRSPHLSRGDKNRFPFFYKQNYKAEAGKARKHQYNSERKAVLFFLDVKLRV